MDVNLVSSVYVLALETLNRMQAKKCVDCARAVLFFIIFCCECILVITLHDCYAINLGSYSFQF